VFSADELKQIRNFGEPILRILGFKPVSTLRFWENLRPSYFIYPSDATVTGSTRTFASLHKKLLQDQLMGLAWLIPRRNQAPVFTAIVPQEEEFDDKGAQTTPPGMHCIVLPFLDDIRANPVDETLSGNFFSGSLLTKASEDLIDKMGEIVRSVTLKSYNPTKYPNPSLQWHYRILQAIALEEELPEQPEDKTLPKYKSIHKRTGPLAVEWGALLNDAAPAGRVEPEPKKRKAISNGKDGETEKKVKREKKSVEPASNDKVESLYEQGNLMSVCDVSNILTEHS
jgi:ATP-dependent DNA helicase 2 subunit 1